jgi:hypothetical protein
MTSEPVGAPRRNGVLYAGGGVNDGIGRGAASVC